MNAKKTVRIVLDALLTIMIVAEMFIQFTGVFLHEVIGFAFFATVMTHLMLSAKWIKNTASTAKTGKLNARRKVLAVMGILLAINMVVLGASSVAISTILASAGLEWTFGPYAIWSAIHSVSSYTLCALVTVHLGMHWAFLASVLRVPYNPSRRRAINAGVNAVAAAGALALGVLAVNQVGSFSGNGYGASNGNGNGSGPSSTKNIMESDDASADSGGSGSNSANSSGSESGVKQRKGKAKGNSGFFSDSSGSSDASGSSGSSNSPGSSSSSGGSSASSSSSGSSTQDSSGSSSEVTGICTLCRKQCPLSDPKCNKPYSAGLL